jgi:hypothetical protein
MEVRRSKMLHLWRCTVPVRHEWVRRSKMLHLLG